MGAIVGGIFFLVAYRKQISRAVLGDFFSEEDMLDQLNLEPPSATLNTSNGLAAKVKWLQENQPGNRLRGVTRTQKGGSCFWVSNFPGLLIP